jgi:hypothetical protein
MFNSFTKKWYWLLLLAAIALILSAIACDGDDIICDPPYIHHGSECCLDVNGNGICDEDEGLPGELPPTTTANATDGPSGQGNNNDNANIITLIHTTQMYDFSAGQYISQWGTTEDIDVITITNEGKARLYAQNDAQIKKESDSGYTSYIDVSEGTTCVLKDNEGKVFSFSVESIGNTTEGNPTATLAWGDGAAGGGGTGQDGGATQNPEGGNDTAPPDDGGLNLELASVIQLTDFTDGNKREYASISGNGEKIIYRKFEPTQPDPHTGRWALWTTDTAGSQLHTRIFENTSLGKYFTLGSLGITPALSYDARYAYFAVEKRENDRTWTAEEVNLGRVYLSDNSFAPINVGVSGYQRVDVSSFRVTTNKIYCVVRLWEIAEGVDARDWSDGKAIVRMDLDGSNQETLFITTKPGADNSPYSQESIFVDESHGKLYYEAYGGLYVLDLGSKKVTKLPETVQDYALRGITQGKLVLYDNSNVFIYDADTGQLSEKIVSGLMQERAVSNGIFYFSCFNAMIHSCNGSFRVADLEGNTKQIIEKDSPQAETRLAWEIQNSAFSGDVVSSDGKRILLTNYWDTGTKNYYILKLK